MQQEATNARLSAELEVTEDNMAIKWKVWKQGFEFYSIATQLNTKPAEVQAATFMSAIGSTAIVIFNTFNLTDQEQKNVDVIKQKFDEYFSPQINETYTRYVFFTCIQGKQETVDSYITKLRTKIKDCAFGDLQDSLLRDQLVRGINSDKVRELLLAEKDLTVNKAIDICRASEQATFQLKEMHSVVNNTEKDIMMIRKSKLKSDTKSVKLKTDHCTWIPATVSDVADTPRSYFVTTPTGKILRRNSAHLRPTKAVIVPDRQVAVNPSGFVRSENDNSTSLDPLDVSRLSAPAFTPPKSKTVVTRSGRVIRPPECLNL